MGLQVTQLEMKPALFSLRYFHISLNCCRLLINYWSVGCWSIMKLYRQGLAPNSLDGLYFWHFAILVVSRNNWKEVGRFFSTDTERIWIALGFNKRMAIYISFFIELLCCRFETFKRHGTGSSSLFAQYLKQVGQLWHPYTLVDAWSCHLWVPDRHRFGSAPCLLDLSPLQFGFRATAD